MKDKKEKPRGLLPDLPTRSEGRYAARPAPRDWTPAEDLAILPWLLAADSERDYLAACRFLCHVLDRNPIYPGTARPGIETATRDCVALIERRTVTGLLIGRPGWNAFATEFHTDARDGTALTWAERSRFLKPYHNKIIAGKPHVDYPELFTILDRNPKGPDLAVIQAYLEQRTHDPHRREMENFKPAESMVTKNLYTAILGFVLVDKPERRQSFWLDYMNIVDDYRGFV